MTTTKPHLVLLVGVMAMVTASRGDISQITQEFSSCTLNCQSTAAVSSILQSVGYSPTCVASSLALCSELRDGHFVTHVEEMRTIMHELGQSTVIVTSCNKSESESVSTIEKGPIWGPRSCKDLFAVGDTGRGLRQVNPFPDRPKDPIEVFCDHTIDGGGWTVFQRRLNSTTRENFQRTWIEYQEGFGDMDGEFWLGLDKLHDLTLAPQLLRVDMEDYDGVKRWARYSTFKVGRTQDHYKLTVGGYTGDAGDSMIYHNNMEFSTQDADHDKSSANCAQKCKGAWWYNSCMHSNPNGYQHVGTFSGTEEGISWYHWKRHNYSLKNITLMIKTTF